MCTTMPGYAVGSRVRRQGLGTRCKAPALAHCSRVRAAVLLSALLDRTGKFPLTGLPCLVGPCLTGWVLGKYLQVLETRTRKEFTHPHHTEPRAVAQCELPAVSPHDYRKSLTFPLDPSLSGVRGTFGECYTIVRVPARSPSFPESPTGSG